jgi:Holliday junction resolvase RusA-like endonuclease
MNTETQTIRFFVPGIPKPGGSKRAFYIKKLGRAIVTDACKDSKTWRQTVAVFAKQAYSGEPLRGPLCVTFLFTMPRPKGHYRSGAHANELRASAPTWHTNKPDLTKLIRSTEDACTGILWADDASIASQVPTKRYGERPGVLIVVEPLADLNAVIGPTP